MFTLKKTKNLGIDAAISKFSILNQAYNVIYKNLRMHSKIS